MKPPRPPRRASDPTPAEPRKAAAVPVPVKRAQAPVRPPVKEVVPARPRPSGQSVPVPTVLGPKDSHQDDINDRRAERKRARRRLLSARFLGALGTALGVIAVAWVLFFSPLFALKPEAITVTGANIDLAPIQATVAEQAGTPLLRINTAGLRNSLLELPTVAEATVSRSWPDGLSVEVTARIPRLAVKTPAGYDSVAVDGVVTSSGSDIAPGLVPVEYSGGIELTVDQVADVIEVWESLDESVRSQVSLLTLDGGLITLQLNGGAQVKWGDAADAQLKTKVLNLLLEQRPSGIYDVTDPTRPSVR